MKYYSQFGQDQYLYETFLKNVPNGFFVEVGADDGIDKSNTYFFEQLGWEGMCIEPSPTRFKMLTANRKAICVNKAIHTEEQALEFIDIVGYGKGLSGIVNNYDPRHLERIESETSNNPETISKSTIIVQCLPLQKVLDKHGITHVNFLSIDVEGSESSVLNSIDFTKTTIDIIDVENNYANKELRSWIENKGYEHVSSIAVDDIFIRKGAF